MKSYKEQVLNVYPDAKIETTAPTWTGGDTKFRWRVNIVDQLRGNNYLSTICYGVTEKEAWKNAWNEIQQMMLRKFEDEL